MGRLRGCSGNHVHVHKLTALINFVCPSRASKNLSLKKHSFSSVRIRDGVGC